LLAVGLDTNNLVQAVELLAKVPVWEASNGATAFK